MEQPPAELNGRGLAWKDAGPVSPVPATPAHRQVPFLADHKLRRRVAAALALDPWTVPAGQEQDRYFDLQGVAFRLFVLSLAAQAQPRAAAWLKDLSEKVQAVASSLHRVALAREAA